MIISLILTIAKYLTIAIITLITGKIAIGNLLTPFEFFLQFIEQGRNCLYLIFGDGLYVLLPIAVILLILRYTLVPIIIIVRSAFINSNP